jgi:YVTN family beta-propeller protein
MTAAARGLARALYRSVRARAPRSAGVLCAAVALQLTVLATALASFAGTKTVKTTPLTAAKLATPAGLATANGGCAGGNEKTNVFATWTASAAEPDADGNPMISGYTLLRSTTSGGSYSSAGTTGVATSFTDSGPSGAEVPQVFVGNGGAAKTVHAVKTSTNEGASLATSGTIGIEPNSMAVNPEGTKVVVAEGASHQVQIITVSTHAVGAAVVIPEVAGVKSRPDAVAITPDGKTAYVVDGANNLVYPLTISTSKIGTAIAVGAQGDPGAIAVTPNGEKVYVANYSAHSVSVITIASNLVTATVTIGGETGKPIALAVTPSSADVYVADQGNAQVDDIATSSDTVSKTITVGSMADANVAGGGDPNILAITPEGAKLYVASYTAGTVSDIATSTDTVTKTITLPGTTPNPNALALTPNGCQLYVHDHANNLLDVVTVSSDAVAASPAVGTTGDPTGMSVTPDSAHVYVANHNGNSVSVIATSTNTVSATLAEATAGKEPYAVLATPSQYFYKLQAGHGGWQSVLTAAVTYTLGFNQGGWQ